MQLKPIIGGLASEVENEEANQIIAQCLAAASQGDTAAYFDLGVAFSTGNQGADCDLIEAHKWFNIAASKGHEEAAWCRADISEEMTAREISEAQRRARKWLADEGYDPVFGARPLKRVIQTALQNPLAELLLAGDVKDGEALEVSAGAEGLIIGDRLSASNRPRPDDAVVH